VGVEVGVQVAVFVKDAVGVGVKVAVTVGVFVQERVGVGVTDPHVVAITSMALNKALLTDAIPLRVRTPSVTVTETDLS